jgi:hypothetical protein
MSRTLAKALALCLGITTFLVIVPFVLINREREPSEFTRDATWPANCPECGCDQVAKILYGYLWIDDSLERAFKKGIFAPGGCALGATAWKCNRCDHEWPDGRSTSVGCPP